MTLREHADLSAALWPPQQPMPSRKIRCRHCGQRNRVLVATAVFEPETCTCGACDGPLFLDADAPYRDLSSRAYEHSLDRKSLAALKSIPGFPAAMRWLLKNASERSLRQLWMASHVECSQQQFPEMIALLDQARHRLDIPYRPQLFLGESPTMNAMTMGVEEPMIVVHSALLDQMDDVEVVTVMAHELGHLHSDHVLYKTLATLLLLGGASLGGMTRLVTFPIQMALLKWSRCAELTADRAALLATRDFPAALRVMLKLAGGHRPGTTRRTQVRLEPFIQQARRLAEMEESSWLDSALATLLAMNQSHPFAAWRVLHLMQWVEKGNYLDILAGDYARVSR